MEACNEDLCKHDIYTLEGRGEEPSIICPVIRTALPFVVLHVRAFASSPQCPGSTAVAIVPPQDNDCIEIQIEYRREKRLKAGDILRQ